MELLASHNRNLLIEHELAKELAKTAEQFEMEQSEAGKLVYFRQKVNMPYFICSNLWVPIRSGRNIPGPLS